MEGDEIFAAMDSLWFYTSVFLPSSPPPKHKQISLECEQELLRPRDQQAETRKTTGGYSDQAPKCVKEAAVATERTAAAAAAAEPRAALRGCRDREWDERMVAWQMEQRRQTRVAAAARCSRARMPPPGEGVAMKAHLRSWAHAVACSVR